MQIRRRPPSIAVTTSAVRYAIKDEASQPRNILEEIVWHKEVEVEKARQQLSLLDLKRQLESVPPAKDFVAALRPGNTHPALIAEVKKASPSKGLLREDFDPVAIAQAYEQGGASCLSVLTDEKFFQGSYENLAQVRSAVELPLLCKEFILYPYQIYLARSKGADAVLLIAAILNNQDLQYCLKIVAALGMHSLIEVHTLEELERVLALDGVTLVGINNRNLADFSVNLQTTCDALAAMRDRLQEKGILVVSESGLHSPADLAVVEKAGADAVLIGESLVKQTDPASAIATLFSSSASPETPG